MIKVSQNLRNVVKTVAILAVFNFPANQALAQDNTADEGVVINGVKWATRNVDEPGTFAKNPENSGMFYQWNRKKAWNTTDQTVVDWDDSTPKGETWTKENDPSPAGWRVPTFDEIEKLYDKKKVNIKHTTINGIEGVKFTDKKTHNFIFLPLVAARADGNGGLVFAINLKFGRYWSSSPEKSSETKALGLELVIASGMKVCSEYSAPRTNLTYHLAH